LLDQANIARVLASCEACRTMAIAVQVVLVVADVRVATPINLAEAVNYSRPSCETLAFAYQLVLSTGGEVALTEDALARVGGDPGRARGARGLGRGRADDPGGRGRAHGPVARGDRNRHPPGPRDRGGERHERAGAGGRH
jgi:hypothetical protein